MISAFRLFFWLCFTCRLFLNVFCIPIDNGVIGEPTVSCGSDELSFWVNTQKQFEGKIYVKGEFGRPECMLQKGSPTSATFSGPPHENYKTIITFRPPQCPPCPSCNNGNPFQTVTVEKYSAGPRPPSRSPREVNPYEAPPNMAHLKIRMGTCNTKRERSLNPPGVSVSVTVVVSFHQLFITKVDRAYQLRCFYMEATKSVSSVLDVSAPLSTELSVQVAMPVCQYSIRRNSADGPELKFAKVGDSVYHTWECLTPNTGIFGMLVHSCSVDDGQGKKIQVLSKQGCTLDKYVIGNLNYRPDLLRASVESHVFKFADRAVVDFQCVITICLKMEGSCEGITPPKCKDARKKRNLIQLNDTDVDLGSNQWNLHAKRFTVVDIDDDIPSEDLIILEEKSRLLEPEHSAQQSESKISLSIHYPSFCLSAVGFGMLISSCTFILTLISVIFGYMYMIRQKFVLKDYHGIASGSGSGIASWLSLSSKTSFVYSHNPSSNCNKFSK